MQLSKTKAKELKKLASKKMRDTLGLFMVEGEKCVLDSLPAFDLQHLVCLPSWIDSHPQFVHKYKDFILLADSKGIEALSSLNSLPEVIGIFKKRTLAEETPQLIPDKFYLLLDTIQDPGNLGTIIRTCDWFGIYDIYASKDTADCYSPKVVQSAMGSLSRVKVHYTDLVDLIEKNPDIRVIGTLLRGIPIREVKWPEGGFLIMGNEGKGVSEELRRKIDLAVTIPPANSASHPDSLNVAIATAIILSSL